MYSNGRSQMAKRKRRKRRPRTRPLRSVIVIAHEGRETENQYFDALNKRYRDANIKPVPRRPTRTEPSQVLADLVKFKDSEGVKYAEGTPYWLVIDVDGRPKSEIDEIANRANSQGCQLADSNPCFEIWLLQHFSRVSQIKRLSGDAIASGCSKVIDKLQSKGFDPSYRKTRYDTSKYMERLEDAISNAAQDDRIDDEHKGRIAGSRVYKLAQSIIDSSPNRLLH